MRILFILKLGQCYSGNVPYSQASGLLNSAKFVVDMLNRNGVEAKLVQVTDNNDVDREVFQYKPSVVVVEALWIVPDKFDVLAKLHPTVKWIIRCHSDFPFLSAEGMAIDWIKKYLERENVSVAFNSQKIVRDLRDLTVDWNLKKKILYLPNFYPIQTKAKRIEHNHRQVHVGCFGAIRPLKNQLVQAVAAIRYADISGKVLVFYINADRCEQGGDGTLRNIRSLFAGTRHHLIEIPWLTHAEFLERMRMMDFALCVSLSETFCITAADAVASNVPLIASAEVPWANKLSVVEETDSDAIVRKMNSFDHFLGSVSCILNRRSLRQYSDERRKVWLRQFAN